MGGCRQFDVMIEETESGATDNKLAAGCAFVVLGVNAVLIGLFTGSFAQGPYSSNVQELWYRYGSLAFFVAGVAVPAFVLFSARRSAGVLAGSIAWMIVTLLAFVAYALMSSGGV